ncbi:putative undecaprenyl diphosphate synthase-domain-containing protein [Obelidium mucronatum]|nr:putative undecaprenyl diphosphate synthase-domain-containing protein [Obelidium mucronatum]
MPARNWVDTSAAPTSTIPSKASIAPSAKLSLKQKRKSLVNPCPVKLLESQLQSSPVSATVLPKSLSTSLRDLFRNFYNWIASMVMALLLRAIRLGPVPKHVAFIMDGNRRFARKRGMQVSKGHAEGADTLEETLDWCLKLGVKTVSVYAFSTENFNRDKETEVDPLMKICAEKFNKFASHSDLVKKHDIAVRVHGRLNLLPDSVLDAAHLATKMTINNANATLNICMPYTSREEIAYAIKTLVRGVEDGMLEIDDIGEEVLEQCFWTGGLGRDEGKGIGGGPLDMLVRTSGEVRLSDYMLWQASSACQIHFLSVYWPDFTFWHMLPALLQYQANYLSLSSSRKAHQQQAGFILNGNHTNDEKLMLRVERVRKFLESVRKQRLGDAMGHM